MAISAQIVKELRDATGAGMMDCKKALVQADGDFAKAEKILKEMGLAAVAKRADRATDNGRIFARVRDGKAVLLELVCETDFVAKNEDFIALGEKMTDMVIDNGYTEKNDALEAEVKDLITKIKENMSLSRLQVWDVDENTIVGSYVHEGALATLVFLTTDNKAILETAEVKELANDLALHVAAYTPSYLSKESVDSAYIEENTEIFMKQAASLGKPEKVLAGIVQGKMAKHLAEICFLLQPFVKDDSMSVEKKVAQVGKDAGASLKVVNYAFFKVGVAQ